MNAMTGRTVFFLVFGGLVACGSSETTPGTADGATAPTDAATAPADAAVQVDTAPSMDAAILDSSEPAVDVVSPPDTTVAPPDASLVPDATPVLDTSPPEEDTTTVDTGVPPTVPLEPGIANISITQAIEGVDTERPVIVHAPKTLQAGATYPVVLFLHGAGGKGQSWVGKNMPHINQGLYVGVYPDGHLKKWNTGYQDTKADDIAFVGMIVERLQGYQQLNLDRLFVVGSSNGAALAHDLAIKTDHFVGITTIVTALTEDSQPNAATQPVSVLQILGKKDNLCKYEGGKAPMGMTFLHAEDSAAVWAAHNGCSTPPEMTTTADGNTRIAYSGCTDGVRVLHYGITEAGHGMPQNIEGGLFPLFWAFFESLP